jgi:hypothetical protein
MNIIEIREKFDINAKQITSVSDFMRLFYKDTEYEKFEDVPIIDLDKLENNQSNKVIIVNESVTENQFIRFIQDYLVVSGRNLKDIKLYLVSNNELFEKIKSKTKLKNI